MAVAPPPKKLPKHCPACNALVVGRPARCAKCNMDFAHVDEFIAARDAALKKGRRNTSIKATDSEQTAGRVKLVFQLAGLLIVGTLAYFTLRHFFGPRPDPYAGFPNDRQALVSQYLSLIGTDQDKDFDRAYQLVSLNARNPDDTDELSKYRQVYHELNQYLAGEFGPDWAKLVKLDPPSSPTDSTITAHVGTETLHVDFEHEQPKDKADRLAAAGRPETFSDGGAMRYGVTGIREFPLDEASSLQKSAAIGGVLNGMGAEGSSKQLNAIVGTFGRHAMHETPIQIKKRLLALVRDPQNPALLHDIYQLWPARNDPTIQHRLEAVTSDPRYSEPAQQAAKEVHDSMASEDILTGYGVVDVAGARQ